MSTGTLLARLVELRASLTNESGRVLRRWADDLEPTLSFAERSALDEVFRAPAPMFDGTRSTSPLPCALRRRVLPVAMEQAQCELETGVLGALVSGFDRLAHHPSAWRLRLGEAIKRVAPASDSIRLELDPLLLGPMLAELLPMEDEQSDDELGGVAGARVRWKDDHLELFLVDKMSSTRVIVTGVRSREWRATTGYLRDERPAVLLLGERYPNVLAPREAKRLRTGPRLHLPVRLASGLLRRIRIFRDVWSIKVVGKGVHTLQLEWRGGPPVESLLTALCHPVTQIAAGGFTARKSPDGRQAEINDLGAPERPVDSPTAMTGRLVVKRFEDIEPHPIRSKAGAMANIWRAWEARSAPSRRRRTAGDLDGLVALRCRYTSEDPPVAERCIAPQAEATGPSAPAARLIAEAHSVHQRILETSLLLAIHEADVPIPADPFRFHQVFRLVSPRRQRLVVELAEAVVLPFLRALLAPVHPNPTGDGVPGLRLTPGQNGITLRLLDASGDLTDAEVEIKNVPVPRWNDLWTEIRRSAPQRPVDPFLDRTPQLSRGERAGLAHHRRVCGPVGLGSAMLRRIGLLSGADGVDVWAGLGKTQIHVEIHNGPSVSSVVEALRDPIAGVCGESTVFDERDGKYAHVQDIRVTPDRFTGDPQSMFSLPEIVLRPLSLATGAGDS
ncbi:hypothetical protein ABZ816_33530 [Actinosynnema sp. NPDC047251]|nr:hypothetical protein [Saccharothrix espanaensis]